MEATPKRLFKILGNILIYNHDIMRYPSRYSNRFYTLWEPLKILGVYKIESLKILVTNQNSEFCNNL